MKNIFLLCLVTVFITTGCMSRAPTTYELDKRAGMLSPTENSVKGVLSNLDSNSSLNKNVYMPARIGPVIQKIWLTDQHLPDGSLLQGTWLFLEVEPAKWHDEVDNYHAKFINDK
jgi:hypothetical protein